MKVPAMVAAAVLVVTACGGAGAASTGSAPGSPGCSPSPCAMANGVTVTVSHVEYGVSSDVAPPPGTSYVTMQVAVKNDGVGPYALAPSNFHVRDGTGTTRPVQHIRSVPSTQWSSFTVARGTTQTRTIASPAASGYAPTLVLVWTPNSSQASTDIEVS